MDEFAGGVVLDQLAAHAARHPHQFAGYLGTRRAPDFQRFGIVAEFAADFGQDLLGILLDQRQAFLVEQVDIGQAAADEGGRGGNGSEAGSAFGIAAAATAGRGCHIVHGPGLPANAGAGTCQIVMPP